MTSITMIRPRQFEIGKMDYSEPKQLSNGGKAIYLNYDNKQLVVQTPLMSCPFGLNLFDGGDYPKYSVDVSFRDMDNNDKLREFYDMMEAIDEQMVEDAVKNSMAWFKKRKQSKEVVKALYSPLVKLSRDRETGEPDGKYPPTFRIKLPHRDGNFTFEAFDDKKEKIPSGDVEKWLGKGAQVRCLIRCTGVWFAGGKFGTTWRAEQVKINPPKGLAGYSFVDDSDDEEGGGDDEEEVLDDSDLDGET